MIYIDDIFIVLIVICVLNNWYKISLINWVDLVYNNMLFLQSNMNPLCNLYVAIHMDVANS